MKTPVEITTILIKSLLEKEGLSVHELFIVLNNALVYGKVIPNVNEEDLGKIYEQIDNILKITEKYN